MVPSTAGESFLYSKAPKSALGHTQPYIQGYQRSVEVEVLPGGQGDRSMKLTTHVQVVLRLRINCITLGLPYTMCTVTSTWRKDEIWQRSTKHVEGVCNFKLDEVITTRKVYDNHGRVNMLFLFGSKAEYFGTWDTWGHRDGVDDDTSLLGCKFAFHVD